LQMSLDYFKKAVATETERETKNEKPGDKKEEKKTAG